MPWLFVTKDKLVNIRLGRRFFAFIQHISTPLEIKYISLYAGAGYFITVFRHLARVTETTWGLLKSLGTMWEPVRPRETSIWVPP